MKKAHNHRMFRHIMAAYLSKISPTLYPVIYEQWKGLIHEEKRVHDARAVRRRRHRIVHKPYGRA